ncbi:serine/threonine-protein kinase [Calothrix sp. 336/3]|uniref:serine/threonine-protein kinase n=1 Tax=Calothrix sp. 336/3 TaxID=1337936 RepID=UPI0004E2EDF6|nr:serine/threonine-protein kinase [Calothrix sp. 336/3]AKG22968.1 serine/threonine protein kinase [Calothrix sp. 336/3]
MQSQTLGGDGRYSIIQQLRQGGFGATYEAMDTQLPGNPKCLVKQLKPRANDENTLQIAKRLFREEAETLQRLGNHDQIPRLLAYFEQDNEFYLVQEYIEGHDLSEELPPYTQPWNEEAVVQLLVEILEVLNFVHKQGVIHRDIKPSNIRRRQSDGKVVLIDFGSVKRARSVEVNNQGQTNFTVAIGTPGYMPSEQANSNPTYSSDVYSVGVIAIQALTGIYPDPRQGSRLPKDPHTGEIVWQHQVDISPWFAEILDNMVRYDFRQRYTTAQAALEALKRRSPDGKSSTVTTIQSNNASVTTISSSPRPTPQKFLFGAIAAAILTFVIASYAIYQMMSSQQKLVSYTDISSEIKIKYPDNWEKQDKRGLYNVGRYEIVNFLSPRKSDQDFQDRIVVSYQDFRGTLEESKEEFRKEISTIPNAQILSEGDVTVASNQGYQIIYTSQTDNKPLKNMQVWTLKGERAYMINYTADIEDYDKSIKTIEDIVKSFEVKRTGAD